MNFAGLIAPTRVVSMTRSMVMSENMQQWTSDKKQIWGGGEDVAGMGHQQVDAERRPSNGHGQS